MFETCIRHLETIWQHASAPLIDFHKHFDDPPDHPNPTRRPECQAGVVGQARSAARKVTAGKWPGCTAGDLQYIT
eukprot:5690926-Pyramimonas_sp.AAC.1